MGDDMMTLCIKNPTYKSKAVREAGDLTVIKPGDAAIVVTDMPDEYRVKLEAAGLIIDEPAGAEPDQADGYSVVDKGRGWFVVTQGDAEMTKSLREDDVAGFADLSAEDQAAFIELHKAD